MKIWLTSSMLSHTIQNNWFFSTTIIITIKDRMIIRKLNLNSAKNRDKYEYLLFSWQFNLFLFTVGLRFKFLLPFGTRRRRMITKKTRKFIVCFLSIRMCNIIISRLMFLFLTDLKIVEINFVLEHRWNFAQSQLSNSKQSCYL